MQNIQTVCPKCQTHYYVSALHLNIANGQVCCSHCLFHFSAYQNIINADQHLKEQTKPPVCIYGKDIFKAKANNSTLDLQTYLNNQRYFQLPNNQTLDIPKKKRISSPRWLTLTLFSACIFLISLLCLHFLASNTALLQQSNFLTTLLNNQWTHFKPLSHTPTVEIEILQVQPQDDHVTTVIGHIINYREQATELPIIQLTLNKTKTRKKIYYYQPYQYLPYFFRNKESIKPLQHLDFRIDLPVENHNFHSVQLNAVFTKSN